MHIGDNLQRGVSSICNMQLWGHKWNMLMISNLTGIDLLNLLICIKRFWDMSMGSSGSFNSLDASKLLIGRTASHNSAPHGLLLPCLFSWDGKIHGPHLPPSHYSGHNSPRKVSFDRQTVMTWHDAGLILVQLLRVKMKSTIMDD